MMIKNLYKNFKTNYKIELAIINKNQSNNRL